MVQSTLLTNDPGHLAHDMIYMLQCLGTFMLDKLTERLAGLPDQLTVLLHELLWVLGESVPWSSSSAPTTRPSSLHGKPHPSNNNVSFTNPSLSCHYWHIDHHYHCSHALHHHHPYAPHSNIPQPHCYFHYLPWNGMKKWA